MMNGVVVNLNVLGVFMEGQVVRKENSSLVITIY